MKCLRTLRRPWIYSIFAFSFFLFLSVFGLSPNSYAISSSCSVSVNQDSPIFSLSDVCDSNFSSLDTFSYLFATDINTSSYSPAFTLYYNTAGGYYTLFSFGGGNSFQSAPSSFPDFSLVPPPNPGSLNLCSGSYPCVPSTFQVRFSNTFVGTFSFVIVDDYFGSGGGSSEPCPVCPVVPENPYDDKFDALTKAIYCCGAILIMLYFFFCIYKIIVKDGGSR